MNVCQTHETRPAIAPEADPFLCDECATACQWHNEQGYPEDCDRDHEARLRDGFAYGFMGKSAPMCSEAISEWKHSVAEDGQFGYATSQYGW